MALYKKQGCSVWYFTISLGNGKRIQGSTHKRDRKEAEAVEALMRLGTGRNIRPDKLHDMLDSLYEIEPAAKIDSSVLWELYSRYLSNSGRALSEYGITRKRRAVAHFADFMHRNHPDTSIEKIDRILAGSYASHINDGERSAKTRKNIIGELSSVWSGIMRVNGAIRENPWQYQSPEAVTTHRLDAFTPDETARILTEADSSGDWGLICRLALTTGLRWGDLCNLPWSAVDLDRAVITLTPRKTKIHGLNVVIPITESVLPMLRARRRTGPFVFPLFEELYPRKESTWKAAGIPLFKAILAAAGVSGRHTFHSFRHTFRTRLSEAGVSPELAKKLGGWTVDTTADRYNHDQMLDRLRAAVNAADK